MSKQKVNCKPCTIGNCAECESIDCLCRESHSKTELVNKFTETASNLLPKNPKELKQILKDSPETKRDYQSNSEEEKRELSEYAFSIMSDYTFKTLEDTDEVLYYSKGVYEFHGEVLIKKECEKIIPECTKHESGWMRDGTLDYFRCLMMP